MTRPPDGPWPCTERPAPHVRGVDFLAGSPMSWSVSQYVKFEDERTRPVRDLVARIPAADVVSAADIGCGPGNSTEVLCGRYPRASIVGFDSSPDMIKAARRRLPGVEFRIADIREWREERLFDVILANAVLQWIPGHKRCCRR